MNEAETRAEYIDPKLKEAGWSDFKTANHAAFMVLRTARKAAWSSFTTASKSCATPVVESSGAEGEGSLGL